MKKITLSILSLLALAATPVFAQESIQSAGFSVENSVSAQLDNRLVDCTKEIVSTSIDMGFGNLNANEVADNFVVEDGELFTITDATVFIIASNGTEFGDITMRFYESEGETPGDLVAEEVLTPTVTSLGALNATLEIFQIDAAFTTSIELSGESGETEYWVSTFTPNTTGASNFLETTDETTDTTLASFKTGNDPDADWASTFTDANGQQGTLDASVAFSLSGDCATLSLEDNNLSEFISAHPNPTNGNLNISSSRNLGQLNINVVNISGQRVLSSTIEGVNGRLDTNKLSSGIYFAEISSNEGATVIKFIKN